MSELENCGEHLSQDEIKARFVVLMAVMAKYNNLKMSVSMGEHLMLCWDRKDPQPNEVTLERIRAMEHFSVDLRGGMVLSDITKEDGARERFIRDKKDPTLDDLLFAERFAEKIDKLFNYLKQKGYKRDLMDVAPSLMPNE